MDDFFDFSSYIVPPILEGPPSSSPQGASYETPYWWDTVNRAIERAAQVATVATAGYPQYPSYPSYPAPAPTPTPVPTPGVTPTPGGSIQLSNTTLMLIVGGALLFMLGKRGR